MQTTESRGGRGCGIFILRHEDFPSQPPYEVSSRMGLLGKNVKGMRPKEAGGQYIDVDATVGDIAPAFCWPNDTRPIPAHNWVWPAIVGGSDAKAPSQAKVTRSGAGGTVQSGGTVNSMMRTSGDAQRSNIVAQNIPPSQNRTVALPSAEAGAKMLPVQGSDMHADVRFAAVGYATPMDPNGGGALWPKFPKGFYGLALPATDEATQVNLLYPADCRLIAVNFGDEPEMGSMVCDVDDEGAIDPRRVARLQSAFRVIKRSNGANALAFQLTFSENEDCEGGLVVDHAAHDVIGRLSFLNGGPLDVGDVKDPHQHAFDDDGNPINPVHLSLQSLFKHKAFRDMDGPLKFDGYWKGEQEAPIRTPVTFEWDPTTQTYRWVGRAWLYVPNNPTGTPTKGDPPVKPPPPPWNPPTPSGGGGGGGKDPPPAGNPPPPNTEDGTAPGYDGPGPDGGDGAPADWRDGDKWRAPPTPGIPKPGDPKGGGRPGNPPAPGAPGGGGGGVIPVGPLPPGSGWKWKNPDGSDPWWPWGWSGGKNGSEEKQKKRQEKKKQREQRRKDRKEKHNKGKKVGVIFVGGDDPRPPDPPLPQGFGWIKWWGKPPKGGIGQYQMRQPPPPNVFSPNIHPGGNDPGSPSTTSPGPSPGYVATPAGRGPMPTGALPGPQFPPAMVNEVMLPSWLARGQSLSYAAPDLRYDRNPRSADIQRHDETIPISGHMQAYYAHGGTVGSNVAQGAPFSPLYTQKPRQHAGRFWQGTANGGWWINTPETDLADQNTDFAPAGVTQSRTYFGAAPRVYFGVGLPDLAQGGMRKGYRWGADTTGNAFFDRMDASGVATPILELGADGILTALPRGASAGQGGQLRFGSPDGTSYTSIQAPDSAASDLVIVLPDTDPVANDVLAVESIAGSTVTTKWEAGTTLASGRWTPTVNGLVNVTTATPSQGQYMRVGSVVTCSVIITVDPAAPGPTSVSVSLPVASNFGAVGDCAGKGAVAAVAGMSGGIYADVANDYAVLGFVAVAAALAQNSWCLDFSYSII